MSLSEVKKVMGVRYNGVVIPLNDLPPNLQEKIATENGEIVPDIGYDGLSKVIVNVESGGTGGTSVQSDWNVNDENDPAYVKNRTHWIENAFEPIIINQFLPRVADTIPDFGFGAFYKVTDTILTKEQLELANISAHLSYVQVDKGSFTYNEEYSAMLGMEVFSYIVWSNTASEEVVYGMAVNATESGSFLDGVVNIPSVGLYMSGLPDARFIDLEISNETIHTLSSDYLPFAWQISAVNLTGHTLDWSLKESQIIGLTTEQHEKIKDSLVCCRVRLKYKVGTNHNSEFDFCLIPHRGDHRGRYDRIGMCNDDQTIYLLSMYCTDETNCYWIVSIKSIPTANSIETAITNKGYLTANQVQSMIDDAIATEEWVFTLEDGTEVKKAVCLK